MQKINVGVAMEREFKEESAQIKSKNEENVINIDQSKGQSQQRSLPTTGKLPLSIVQHIRSAKGHTTGTAPS